MNKEFAIQFLDDKKFEALSLVNPRYVNTKDDLGFADMKINKIFVRKTGVKLMDMFTTQHEIDEILAKNSSHEDEFNIRHKKVFKEVIAPILAPLVGTILGGPAGAALGVGSTIGGAVGGAAGSAIQQAATTGKVQPLPTILSGVGGAIGGKGMARGIQASRNAPIPGGYIGQTLSGAQSMLGFQSGAEHALQEPLTTAFEASQAINPALSAPVALGGRDYAVTGGISRGLSAAALPATAAAIPAATGLGFGHDVTTPASIPSVSATSTPISPLTQQFQQTVGGGTDLASKIGLQTPTMQPSVASPTATPPSTATSPIRTAAQQIGTGVATNMAMGQLSQQKSTTPMLDDLLGENWRQMVLGASVPLLGQSAAPMFGVNPTPEPFSAEQSQLFNETANMVRQGAQVELNAAQQKAIISSFDTALEQARQNIMDRYKMLRPGSDIENDSNFREALIELETEFAEKKANALAGAQLGLSLQQTQMMSELASMEIYTLAMKAGITYQEAKDFKDLLGQIGFMIGRSGQPIYMAR